MSNMTRFKSPYLPALFILSIIYGPDSFATLNATTREGQEFARILTEARELAKNGQIDRAVHELLELLRHAEIGKFPVQINGQIINARTETLRALREAAPNASTPAIRNWIQKFKHEGDESLEEGDIKHALEMYRLGREIAPEYREMLKAMKMAESLLTMQSRVIVNPFTLLPVHPGNQTHGTEWISEEFSIGQRRIRLGSDEIGNLFWLVFDATGTPVAPHRISIGTATTFSGRQFIARSRVIERNGEHFLLTPEGLIRINSSGEIEEHYLPPYQKLNELGLSRYADMLQSFENIRRGAPAWKDETVLRVLKEPGYLEAFGRANPGLYEDTVRAVTWATESRRRLNDLRQFGLEYVSPFLEQFMMDSMGSELAKQSATLLYGPNFQKTFNKDELIDPNNKEVHAYELIHGLASKSDVPYLLKKLSAQDLETDAAAALYQLGNRDEIRNAMPELIKALRDMRDVQSEASANLIRLFRNNNCSSPDLVQVVLAKLEARELIYINEVKAYLTQIGVLQETDIPPEQLDRTSIQVRAKELTTQVANTTDVTYLKDVVNAPMGDRLLKYYAIQALANLGPSARDAIPFLMEQYSKEEWDPELSNPIREILATAILQIATSDEAIPFILAEAEKPAPLPVAAIRAIGRIGYPLRTTVFKLRRRLNELTEESTWSTRDEILEIIGTLGRLGKESAPALPALVNAAHPHQSMHISVEALHALARIGSIARPYYETIRDFKNGFVFEKKYRAAYERTLRMIGKP